MGGGRSGSRPTVVVVGLGRMGMPVLERLAGHHDVLGHDLDARCAPLVARHGGRWCAGLAEAAASAEVLVTVLPGPEETAAVVRQAVPLLPSGALWLDLGSGLPATTTALAEAAAAARPARRRRRQQHGPRPPPAPGARRVAGGARAGAGAPRS